MALTKCSECGCEISDRALACPQCGCPQNAEAFGGSTSYAGTAPPPSSATPLPLLGLLDRMTNPRLPRMANWICIYCLAVNPVIMIFFLVFFTSSIASLWSLPLDIAITVVLILSGLKLKRLQASARQWVTGGLYASLAIDAFELWSGMFIDTGNTAGETSGGMVVVILLAVFIAIALVAFRIVALVWLHRHGNELPLDKSGLC